MARAPCTGEPGQGPAASAMRAAGAPMRRREPGRKGLRRLDIAQQKSTAVPQRERWTLAGTGALLLAAMEPVFKKPCIQPALGRHVLKGGDAPERRLMATARLTAILRQLHQFADGQAEELMDGELLECFARGRDEAAFALLVRRHGPMVLGVCRRVLRDVHAAEDAFQAAFLVLARRADSIRRKDSVGGWLFRVAYRTAVHARARRARQRGWERMAAAPDLTEKLVMHADPLTEMSRREEADVLDEELQCLPEQYRDPILLCCLQGMTHESAARHLSL